MRRFERLWRVFSVPAWPLSPIYELYYPVLVCGDVLITGRNLSFVLSGAPTNGHV